MLENPGVADYLRDFEYDASDYGYHNIFLYRGEPYLDARQDWPYGVTLGDTTYYNLIPGHTYHLSPLRHGELSPAIDIQTLGQLRMIRAEGIDNVRDLGGWPTTNGKRLRYGLLFRGTEMNTMLSDGTARRSAHRITESDRRMLLEDLGIRAELDFRASSEKPGAFSALGEQVEYDSYSIDYTQISSPANRALIVKSFRFLLKQVEANRPTYIHCIWGADRTGVFCMLIEGLMGMSQSDIDKEYELTSFSGNSRFRNNNRYQPIIQFILEQEGKTFQEKIRKWWLDSGANNNELDKFIRLMTE